MAQPGRPRKIKYASPEGMYDILSKNQRYFQEIFDVCAKMAEFYGFGRIETPILEKAELFIKGIGQNTDIIEKQMYTLKTEEGDVLALRPEYTTSVTRAFIEKDMESKIKPVKLWYFGPCFRYEDLQADPAKSPTEIRWGIYGARKHRQFWQVGFEVLGERSPVVDAQIIQLFINILKKLKLKNLLLQINSIGDPRCRARYKKILARFLKSYERSLCSNCRRRLKQNPLRVLDCRNEKCQQIITQGPQVVDYLCKKCRYHFKEVLEFLDILAIPYRLNPYLARGFDYYTRTVFEVFVAKPSEEINSDKVAIAGGGRHDGLIRLLGGKDTAGCGMAAGIESIVDSMKKAEIVLKKKEKPQIFLAQLGALGKKKALVLFEEFRKAKLPIYEAFSKDSLWLQLNRANKLGTKYILILGQKEALENRIIVRNIETGTQRGVQLNKIINVMKKELKK